MAPGIVPTRFPAAASFHRRRNARVAFPGTRQQTPGFAEAVIHPVFTALGRIHVYASLRIECIPRNDEPGVLGKYVKLHKVDLCRSVGTQNTVDAMMQTDSVNSTIEASH
jgi:hypothetical protein